MPRSDIMPGSDGKLAGWLSNFSSKISQGYESLGITLADAQRLAGLEAAWVAALSVLDNPEKRTSVAVKRKNTARAAVKAEARRLAALVRHAAGVSDNQLVDLRLRPHKVGATRARVPQEMPWLRVLRTRGHRVEVAVVADRRPEGAAGLFWYLHAGEKVPTDLAEWRFGGGTTRLRKRLHCPPGVEPGTPVWVTASWVNPRFEPGPPAAPAVTRVGFEAWE